MHCIQFIVMQTIYAEVRVLLYKNVGGYSLTRSAKAKKKKKGNQDRIKGVPYTCLDRGANKLSECITGMQDTKQNTKGYLEILEVAINHSRRVRIGNGR